MDAGLNLALWAHADDVSRLIGHGGRMVKALRFIVSLAAARCGKTNASLFVSDPVVGETQPHPMFKFNPDYDVEPDIDLLEETVTTATGATAETTNIEINPQTSLLVVKTGIHVLDRDRLEEALNTIWLAIGRSHGKTLRVEVS